MTQTQQKYHLAVDATALDRLAPANIGRPECSSLQQNEAKTSAVNVHLMESNGSLIRTDNTRISLYGSDFMFNHTPHIRDNQQYSIFCMYCWMRDFSYLYKAFYRKI